MRGDSDQHIFLIQFRVLNEDVKVAVVVEDAGIEQFILRLVIASPLVLLAKLIIRKSVCGYLYSALQ